MTVLNVLQPETPDSGTATKRAHADHRRIKLMLVEIEKLQDEEALLDKLESLADTLAEHFAFEESPLGYFAELMESQPHVHSKIDRLRTQHSRIRSVADELIQEARLRIERRREYERELAELLHLIRAHERAEHRLAQDAMLIDIGVGD